MVMIRIQGAGCLVALFGLISLCAGISGIPDGIDTWQLSRSGVITQGYVTNRQTKVQNFNKKTNYLVTIQYLRQL
jgi:hypothetical protein